MSSMLESAQQFFDGCETGKGWEFCKDYCHENASFSAQAGAMAEIHTLEGYCQWMQDFFTPLPDAHYELKFIAADESRNAVTAVAIFHGTQTGPGGPVPPTGKTVAADYAYWMEFDGGRIKHMTKIWNDTISLQQLGWA
jgi:steroid delta-isomerase-like uncharacterized protein